MLLKYLSNKSLGNNSTHQDNSKIIERLEKIENMEQNVFRVPYEGTEETMTIYFLSN